MEDRIRPDPPPRDVERRADRLLAGMSDAFAKAYRHARPAERAAE